MSTETKDETQNQWVSVREAITERWPQIDRDELAECPDDCNQLINFVKHRVEASDEEVVSVIQDLAHQDSLVDQVTHAASDGLHQASEAAQFAYMRADECIAKRPTQSVLASFVAGIALGATVTALWLRSRQQPSTWDRVKARAWR